MKLLNIKISNFQGIKDIEFNFENQKTKIYGTNGTGKTTVANAFTWLLFGRSHTDIKDFSPKPQGADGTVKHNIITNVKAEFLTDEGNILKLEKLLKEVWRTKKGYFAEEFAGNTTEFFINDVPTKAGDYQNFIESYATSEQLKVLSMPFYFSEVMGWKERRALLLDIFGNISNDDVFTFNAELLPLKEHLEKVNIDDFITKNKYVISNSKKLLDENQVRIDELNKIEVIVDNSAELEKQKAELNNNINALRSELSTLKSNSNAATDKLYNEQASKFNDELSFLNNELSFIKNKKINLLTKKQNEEEAFLLKYQAKLDEINKDLQPNLLKKSGLESEINRLESDILTKTKERSSIIDKLNSINAREFDKNSTICPTCKREFENAKVEELINNFNNSKAEELKHYTEYAQRVCSKEVIAGVEKNKDEAVKQLEELKTVISDIEAQKNTAKKLYDDNILNLNNQYNSLIVNVDSEVAEINNKIAVVNNNISTLKAAILEKNTEIKSEEVASINNKIDELLSIEKDINIKLLTIQQQQTTLKRIAELEEESKKNIVIYEEAEELIELAELFIKTKMEMLNSKINDKFNNIKFKLFEIQINGGLKETCEVLVPDGKGNNIDFSVANNAGKINASIEVINYLSSVWGKSLPIFVDNAESVVKLADTDIQTIELIVDENSSVLTIK